MLLTVHTRPPFPFTFCFLPPVNSGGTVGTVFRPVGLWDEHSGRRPHSVLAPYPGKSLLPAFRFAARPTSGTIYSRPRKKSSVGKCRCPHRQERYSPRPHSYSTPGVLRRWLVSAVPGSCGSACRPACAPTVASLCMGYFSCVPPFVFRCRSPRKGFLPHSCGVFRRWRAPHSFGTTCPEVTSGQSVQKSVSLRCFPGRGISFRTVIRFSRCCPSMNYPKSTPK